MVGNSNLHLRTARHANVPGPVAYSIRRRRSTIEDNAPALSVDGAWTVYLESVSSREAAERARARLQALGFPAVARAAEVGARTWFRVALPGFQSRQGAIAFTVNGAGRLGFRTPWVAGR